MMVGRCQTVSPIAHTLCTKVCFGGAANLPSQWEVRPERVICDGQIKFKAVLVTSECQCTEMEEQEPYDDMFGFLDLR